MPTIWNRKYGFQLRVSHKLLPKDFWATFDTRGAAEQYGRQLEAALLERGDLSQPIWTLQRCVTEYLRNNLVPDSDVRLLDTILVSLASVRTDVLNYDWAERWVDSMKREDNLAPSTIRHRHGALFRLDAAQARRHHGAEPAVPAQAGLRDLHRRRCADPRGPGGVRGRPGVLQPFRWNRRCACASATRCIVSN
jgi:hypothetical protein